MATNVSPPDPIYRTIATAIAEIEGADAFGAGTPRCGNPYEPDDLRCDGWLTGWDRRDGDSYWSTAQFRSALRVSLTPVASGTQRVWEPVRPGPVSVAVPVVMPAA